MSGLTFTLSHHAVQTLNGVEHTHVQKLGAELVVTNKGAHLWGFKTAKFGELVFRSSDPAGHPTTLGVTRGGSHPCFPNFGPDTQERCLPLHGFIRDATHIRVTDKQRWPDSDLVFQYQYHGQYSNFPQPFSYRTHYSVQDHGNSLHQVVEIESQSGKPIKNVQFAMHDYDLISNRSVLVKGLEGHAFLNRLTNEQGEANGRAFCLADDPNEVNRLYSGALGPLTIVDQGLGRQVQIIKEGMPDWVVWNHGSKVGVPFMGAEDLNKYICLEPVASELVIPAMGAVVFSRTLTALAL